VPVLPGAVRLAGDTVDMATHPVRSLGQLVAVGSSLGRLMAPARRPMSPIMTGRSFRRHAEIIDLDLTTLKHAAKAWGPSCAASPSTMSSTASQYRASAP
jgi:hypothetical protein